MIVMQLLEKNPANRIQSAHELSRRLRTLRSMDAWDPEQAEQWWNANLPELARFKPVDHDAETEAIAEPVLA
jgi:hypothetical protein